MSKDKKDIKLIDINNDNFFDDEENYFNKNAKYKKNDNFLTKLVIISVLLSFILIAIVTLVPFDRLSISLGKKDNADNTLNLFKKRENILFLGVDSNGKDSDPFDKTRTDTIMLASIDKVSKSVNVISIPRDSKVYIAGHGIDKINAAHATGGVDLTIQTIQEMFGVKIDHYILVDFRGLKEIVKVLGTVPVTVDKKLKYTDYSGHLFVNLNPGKQELNADQVEQFVRFRHDAIGDLGRVERQRMLMKGIVTKLQSPEAIAKIPEIISVANKYVKTDMTVFDMTRYAGVAKSINVDDVVTATLPGGPSAHSSISYWILDPDKSQAIIDRLVYRIERPTPQTEPLKISILYDEATAGKLSEIEEILKNENMEVICTRKTKKLSPEIIAHTDNITTVKYKHFKTLLPQLKSAPMNIAYDFFYCGESDATLVLVNP